jgi:phage shock protein C
MTDVNGRKRLVRPMQGRMVAGVCAGLGDYFAVDPNIVRLVFAVLTIFGGAGALAYLLAWVLVPDESEPESIAERYVGRKRGT